jgi:hypothetical protein
MDERMNDPAYNPELDDITPAYLERASQRVERTDREILIDLQERMVRMEDVFAMGGVAMNLLSEAIRKEGLIGIARVIPEMIRLSSEFRKGSDGN